MHTVFTRRFTYESIILVYRELPYWFGEECNMINGTGNVFSILLYHQISYVTFTNILHCNLDGTMTPAFPNKEDRIYFFVDDICR